MNGNITVESRHPSQDVTVGQLLPVLGVQSCLLALVLTPIWPCVASMMPFVTL